MAFKVYTMSRNIYGEYGDDESFTFREGGVLEITRPDGSKHYLNPAVWGSIDEDAVAASSPLESVY